MSEEALQIAEKRREAKGKGKKERYTHLNAEFQTTAKTDKKAFLSDQCRKREESNRMGKPRDLVKKIRDTKGIFHAKMGTSKDRNGMDLQKQEVLRRGGKNTQSYTKVARIHRRTVHKKDLHDTDNHDGVITDLEPDILEC